MSNRVRRRIKEVEAERKRNQNCSIKRGNHTFCYFMVEKTMPMFPEYLKYYQIRRLKILHSKVVLQTTDKEIAEQALKHYKKYGK